MNRVYSLCLDDQRLNSFIHVNNPDGILYEIDEFVVKLIDFVKAIDKNKYKIKKKDIFTQREWKAQSIYYVALNLINYANIQQGTDIKICTGSIKGYLHHKYDKYDCNDIKTCNEKLLLFQQNYSNIKFEIIPKEKGFYKFMEYKKDDKTICIQKIKKNDKTIQKKKTDLKKTIDKFEYVLSLLNK